MFISELQPGLEKDCKFRRQEEQTLKLGSATHWLCDLGKLWVTSLGLSCLIFKIIYIFIIIPIITIRSAVEGGIMCEHLVWGLAPRFIGVEDGGAELTTSTAWKGKCLKAKTPHPLKGSLCLGATEREDTEGQQAGNLDNLRL